MIKNGASMKFFNFTKEGLPIDSESLQGVDNKWIAAICAVILNVSESFLKEYALGKLKRILIDAGDEAFILSRKGENGLLSIIESNRDLGQGYLKDIEKYKICKSCGSKILKNQKMCLNCGESVD